MHLFSHYRIDTVITISVVIYTTCNVHLNSLIIRYLNENNVCYFSTEKDCFSFTDGRCKIINSALKVESVVWKPLKCSKFQKKHANICNIHSFDMFLTVINCQKRIRFVISYTKIICLEVFYVESRLKFIGLL